MNAYILIGAPGSGKSTWGKKFVTDNPGVVRLCPDEFRAKFGTGESDQSVSAQAFSATRVGMEHALNSGKDVLIDATNMHHKGRKDFLVIAKKYNATKIAIVFEAAREILIERNQKRGAEGGRVVPDNVIDRMLSNYQVPTHADFDEIKFISRI
jgi:predicted kinase